MNLLEVENLRVRFGGNEVVRGVSFAVRRGECVALVGESGCGKSMTSLALTRLPPTDAAEVSGRVLFRGAPVAGPVRGIAYVFQDPMASLNPVMKVGAQMREAFRAAGRTEEGAADLLAGVGLPDPRAILSAYPCELSGGMCQRVMIAMALAGEPELLVADEPTTALDVTTQAEVMDLIGRIVRERSMALLLATHNLGLVSGRCDTVNVLYAGQIVETGPVAETLSHPRHPYTRGLLHAVPRIADGRANRLRDIPGTVPSPAEIAGMAGCAFAPRCPLADDICRAQPPPGGPCRCHRAESAR
ncbi:MAG: ABC transporter ATP-binding protein [Kiritimatiellae bacterium]|nr:ABC transporter ATP-binding protein [Kiritimatiellia bacterium]